MLVLTPAVAVLVFALILAASEVEAFKTAVFVLVLIPDV